MSSLSYCLSLLLFPRSLAQSCPTLEPPQFSLPPSPPPVSAFRLQLHNPAPSLSFLFQLANSRPPLVSSVSPRLAHWFAVETKAEFGRPSPLQPNRGKVSTYVDCSPTAAPTFEGRGGEELSTELSVALQRCLLGGKSGAGAGIDLSSLIVVEGKVRWDLYIDGLVVSSDGNLQDALGASIKAALSNTGIPRVHVAAEESSEDQPELDISDEEFLQFDTSGVPVIVTLTKVGRHYIVDATLEEESQMSSAVSVSINICGLTERGGAGLDPNVILDVISVAKHVSQRLIDRLDSEISTAEAIEEE